MARFVAEFGKQSDRFLICSYERMQREPLKELARMGKFLGVPEEKLAEEGFLASVQEKSS